MGEPSTPKMVSFPSNTTPESENDDRPPWFLATKSLFQSAGIFTKLPEGYAKKDSYSDLIRGLLKAHQIQRGRIICFLTVKPAVINIYGSLHGGAVAAIAELVAKACVRTVIGDDQELFLGECAMSYLSAALVNVELEVEGCIVRHGRNVTVTSVEFKVKETRKVVYIARATFYCMPIAKL